MQTSADSDRKTQSRKAGPVDSVLDSAARSDTAPTTAPVSHLSPRGGAVPSHQPEGTYSRLQRWLHWAVAALVVLQLTVGTIMGLLAEPSQGGGLTTTLLTVHLLVGTVIFGLMCFRASVRQRYGAPPSPEGTPYEASVLARINHLGFYALLLTLPVLGWLAFLTKPPADALFGSIHGGLALVLFLAICAHLGGVAYHRFIRRDGSLRRMTTG